MPHPLFFFVAISMSMGLAVSRHNFSHLSSREKHSQESFLSPAAFFFVKVHIRPP